VNAMAPEDQLLSAYFDERMEATAERVLADLVARVLADDTAKDALIADLTILALWCAPPRRLWRLTPDDARAMDRALAYVASLP
jgi:hypothetical protein